MAFDYIEKFATLAVNLNRQQYGPLDVSSVFNSTADLTYYRTKGDITEGVSEYWYKNEIEKVVPFPYEGQLVSLIENGEVSVFKLVANSEGTFDAVAIGGGTDPDDTIKITSFSHNLGTVECGSVVNSVTLQWKINKIPKTLTLNGEVLSEEDINNGRKTLSVNITMDSQNKGFKLVATDENGSTDEESVYITFANGIYYGVINDGAIINDANLQDWIDNKQVSKNLQSLPNVTFTATADQGQVFFYAFPESDKTLSFTDAETNFSAGMYKQEQPVSLNPTGKYPKDYHIYLSGQSGLGKMTIIVSEVK